MADGFELQGIDELLDNLQKMSQRVETRTINQALEAGGKVLADAVSQKTPRSKLETKHMADYIVVSKVKTDPSGLKFVEVGPAKGFFYGSFLEWGTQKMPAHPFMYPAFVEKRGEITEKMAAVLREALQK